MLESMSDVYEKIVEASGFLLEPIKRRLAEELVNMGQEFTILNVEREQWVSFEVMLENEGKLLNVSYRYGQINDDLADMPLFSMFYNDGFREDGFLVHFDGNEPVFSQLEKVVDLTECRFYFGGNMMAKELQKLPCGRYLLIDGGGLLKKVLDMNVSSQNMVSQERNRNI